MARDTRKTMKVVRTVQASAPDSNRSWFVVRLPSGETVEVKVWQTRGEMNNRVVMDVTTPRGAVLTCGENVTPTPTEQPQ